MISREDCEDLLRIERFKNLQFLNSTLEKILLLSNIEELKNKSNRAVREEFNEKIEQLIHKNDDLLEGKLMSPTVYVETVISQADSTEYWIKTYLDTFLEPKSSYHQPSPVEGKLEDSQRFSHLLRSPLLSTSIPPEGYFTSLFPPASRSPRSPRENAYDHSNGSNYYDDDNKEERDTIFHHLARRIENLKNLTSGGAGWTNEYTNVLKDIKKLEKPGNRITFEDIIETRNQIDEDRQNYPSYYDSDNFRRR